MKNLFPAVVLFFLAPAVAELLSGSAPPAEFFTGFGLIILPILYGGGALLARELTLRWRKGWPSLLALGAAYAIIEEGLMVKSFFDPGWVDIGLLGSYGRWAGINWVWSLELTIYHAVISIVIPITLTGLIFADRRGESWIGKKTSFVLAGLFTADIVFGYNYLTLYRPAAGIYWLAVLAVIGLIALARLLPAEPFTARATALKKPVRFWLFGFIGTVVFLITFWILPGAGVPVAVTLVLGAGEVAAALWLILRMTGNGKAWGDIHQLALAAGPLSVFILLTPFHEFVLERTDNPSGMTLVGLATLLLVLWLFFRVRRRSASQPSPEAR